MDQLIRLTGRTESASQVGAHGEVVGWAVGGEEHSELALEAVLSKEQE